MAAAWAADAGGLGRLARSRDVALVHTNTSVTLGGAAAARVAGIPHVWHVREIYAGFERWFDRLPAPAAERRRAAVRLAGDAASSSTARRRRFVLHDGLAIDPRARRPRDARAGRSACPHDAFVVAVLGRISGWKGQDVLVRALGAGALRGATTSSR